MVDTLCNATRLARNSYADKVDRVVGLAYDLKGRMTRMLARTTCKSLDISYNRSDETHDYDDRTLGKTSWRLTNGIHKLWKLQAAMQRHEFEQAFADADDGIDSDHEEPCDDLPHDWVHLEDCTTGDDGKVSAGKCNVFRIQKLVTSVKAFAKRAACIMRKACRTLIRDKIDGSTQGADKQMFKYLRRDQAPRAAAMYDPDAK